ncbi:hypothetical protein B566_EDAN013276 [Ephemera danica]|nr:hypothetical protein B566_EDAN013276 [Ephemera danica]
MEAKLQMELLRKEVETKCLGVYNSRMRDGTNDNILNKTKMDELHKKCADAAIVEFNNLAGFENKEQFETSQSEFLQLPQQGQHQD